MNATILIPIAASTASVGACNRYHFSSISSSATANDNDEDTNTNTPMKEIDGNGEDDIFSNAES